MKNLRNLTCTFFLSTALGLSAGDMTWTGGGGDELFATGANWSDNVLPPSGSFVTMDKAGEVSSEGLPNGYLPARLIIRLKGNSILKASPVYRLDNTELTVGAGSGFSGGWIAFYDAKVTFANNSSVNIQAWEQNGKNEFTFVIGQSGFEEISAKSLYAKNLNDVTYIADLGAYKGDEKVIPLLVFKHVENPFTEEEFHSSAVTDVSNPGIFTHSKICWNAEAKAIELRIAK